MKKILLSITIVFFGFILTCFMSNVFNSPAKTLSKYGSTGDEVVDIQTVLKTQGYYSGNIDGIFGSGTKNAVVQYQKDNGLDPDGIVGQKTLKAMGLSSGGQSAGGLTSSDMQLLARIISAESRGEPYIGQVAVGAVILNRMEHPSFPNTLSGVIYQPSAFSCVDDGQINEPVSDSATRAAQDAVNGFDPSGGAIYYYNPSKTSNKFMLSRPVITVIGAHKFCS